MAGTFREQARVWLNALRNRWGHQPEIPLRESGPQIVNLSAASVEPQQQGISFDQAKPIVVAFAELYQAARNITYMLGGNEQETFGNKRPGQFAELRPDRSGHNFVLIALNNTPNPQSLLETLNHEVLGHWGVNTFTPLQKRALLDRIVEARMQPGLKDVWRFVDRAYCGQSELRKAEEVYAVLTEAAAPDGVSDMDKAQEAWKAAVVDRSRVITLDDLINIQSTVNAQIREGRRVQKTYPWRDQFSAMYVGNEFPGATGSVSRGHSNAAGGLRRISPAGLGSDGPIEQALTVSGRGSAEPVSVRAIDWWTTQREVLQALGVRELDTEESLRQLGPKPSSEQTWWFQNGKPCHPPLGARSGEVDLNTSSAELTSPKPQGPPTTMGKSELAPLRKTARPR